MSQRPPPNKILGLCLFHTDPNNILLTAAEMAKTACLFEGEALDVHFLSGFLRRPFCVNLKPLWLSSGLNMPIGQICVWPEYTWSTSKCGHQTPHTPTPTGTGRSNPPSPPPHPNYLHTGSLRRRTLERSLEGARRASRRVAALHGSAAPAPRGRAVAVRSAQVRGDVTPNVLTTCNAQQH